MADGGEAAEVHRHRSVAVNDDYFSAVAQRKAMRYAAGEPHGAEHIEILWAIPHDEKFLRRMAEIAHDGLIGDRRHDFLKSFVASHNRPQLTVQKLNGSRM